MLPPLLPGAAVAAHFPAWGQTVPQEARGLRHPEGQQAVGRPASEQRLPVLSLLGGQPGPPGFLCCGTFLCVHH